MSQGPEKGVEAQAARKPPPWGRAGRKHAARIKRKGTKAKNGKNILFYWA